MVNHKIQAQAIKNAINAANSILLIAHKKPDADTLGSVCAWMHILESRGKNVTAFCLDPVPDYLRHLPGSHSIQQDPALFEKDYDLIIVNDSGDLEYAGVDVFMEKRNNTATTLINIDHHATNPDYGDINLVIRDASSNAEVLSRLFLHWSLEFSKPVAECLLHGLVSDTDKLTNPSTSYHALTIISHLVEAGADLYRTIQRSLYNKSISDLKLWGLVLSRLSYNAKYSSVATYVTDTEIQELGGSPESLKGMSNYLSLTPNVNMILFIHAHEDGHVKGSMRTVRDNVDIGKLSLLLGGGGHKKAAGFRIPGSIVVENDHWTIV